MKYRVEWVQEAIQRLADIWSRAPDQGLVAAASYAIDRALAGNPLNEGESRPGGRRVMFSRPLGVYFRVDLQTRTVHVLDCWFYRTR